jgi:hypothetical protein
LSDFDATEWSDALLHNPKLQQFADFRNIWPLIKSAPTAFDVDEKKLRPHIKALGRQLLATDDIAAVRAWVNRMLGTTFTYQDIEQVKKYNFASSSISFTPENYYSWVNIARGNGSIDDLRYIKHELYELMKLSGMNLTYDVATHHQHEDHFCGAYDSAHHDALIDEMKFLAKLVKKLYGYPAGTAPRDWKYVACSDLERGEEFLPALAPLSGSSTSATSSGSDDDAIVDVGAIKLKFPQYVDNQLSRYLTMVKLRRFVGG